MPLAASGFPCCRAHNLYDPVEDYAKSILRTPGDEVYWFKWNSSFDGKATIRIARFGAKATVCRIYRAREFGRVRRYRGSLRQPDWRRLEQAISAANFWMLDELERRCGLDGCSWGFAGRRGQEYHYISRWSPRGALWDLGRLLFDVAGLTEVKL